MRIVELLSVYLDGFIDQLSEMVKYQVIVLGGAGDGRSKAFSETIRKRVEDLGLSPVDALQQLQDPDVAGLDTVRAPTATVFFGEAVRAKQIDDAAAELRSRGNFVLPVVPDVQSYNTYVPASLSGINGFAPDAADPKMEAVTQRVLEELRLVRAKRLVFVSYRRDESRAAAEQLYHAFDERSFDVFLDTHSVRSGLEFQSILFDRMADADLLVFIDTPKALSSRWVRDELARAQALGLGVLQVVWPGWTRTPGTEFCEPLYLEPKDIEDPSAKPSEAKLVPAVVQHLVTVAEGLRARSIAARRARLVGEIWSRASTAGLTANIQPARCVDLTTKAGATRRVFPVVGHPDSIELSRCFDECVAPTEGVLLYDPLGMLDPKRLHLGWLNEYLPLKAVSVMELDKWLGKI